MENASTILLQFKKSRYLLEAKAPVEIFGWRGSAQELRQLVQKSWPDVTYKGKSIIKVIDNFDRVSRKWIEGDN